MPRARMVIEDIYSQCRLAGLPEPETEALVVEGRAYRWDLAWGPPYMVAVDRQGATHRQGHHTRGTGYRDDCEKLALGQLAGWLVVWVTSDMERSGLGLDLVERALKARGWRQS